MSEEFGLVYFHRETGEKYLVKRITVHDYIIMDPRTLARIPISKWFLDKSFKADKANRKPRKISKLNFKNRKAS